MDGLEGDTRDARAGLFGENVIDIEEKPVRKLLIDEVLSRAAFLLPSSSCDSVFFRTVVEVDRSSIHSTSSKSSPLYYGPPTNTTTTQPVFSSSASQA